MSAGIAPGSRRENLWGINNRCWGFWAELREHIFIRAAQDPLPLESSYWRQKNIRAKPKLLSCPCFGKKQSPVQQRFLWCLGNLEGGSVAASTWRSVTWGNKLARPVLLTPESQALRSKIVLGLLCAAPENYANSISPCFLSCWAQCKRQHSVLKYRSLLWGSEMKGCLR